MCSGSQGEFNEITPEFIGGWFIPISSHFTDLHRYDHRPHVRRPYVLHTLRAIARYSCHIYWLNAYANTWCGIQAKVHVYIYDGPHV